MRSGRQEWLPQGEKVDRWFLYFTNRITAITREGDLQSNDHGGLRRPFALSDGLLFPLRCAGGHGSAKADLLLHIGVYNNQHRLETVFYSRCWLFVCPLKTPAVLVETESFRSQKPYTGGARKPYLAKNAEYGLGDEMSAKTAKHLWK